MGADAAILLVMQTVDTLHDDAAAALVLALHQDLLDSDRGDGRRVPGYIPAANQAARWSRRRSTATRQSTITEALLDVPTTAHILGGCVIGPHPETA